jgi:hypothetical protein
MLQSGPLDLSTGETINQIGYGQFRAQRRRQRGHGVYKSRRRRQRGHGLGTIFSQVVKKAAPIVKKHLYKAGRQALKQAPKLIVSRNKPAVAKAILKSVGKQAIGGLAGEVINHVQPQPKKKKTKPKKVRKHTGRRRR